MCSYFPFPQTPMSPTRRRTTASAVPGVSQTAAPVPSSMTMPSTTSTSSTPAASTTGQAPGGTVTATQSQLPPPHLRGTVVSETGGPVPESPAVSVVASATIPAPVATTLSTALGTLPRSVSPDDVLESVIRLNDAQIRWLERKKAGVPSSPGAEHMLAGLNLHPELIPGIGTVQPRA